MIKKTTLALLLSTVMFAGLTHASGHAANEPTISTATQAAPDEVDIYLGARAVIISKIGDNTYQAILSDLIRTQKVTEIDENSDKEKHESLKKFDREWHKKDANSFSSMAPMGTLTILSKIITAKFTDFRYDPSNGGKITLTFKLVQNMPSGKLDSLPKGIILDKPYTNQDVRLFIDSIGL